MLVEPGWSVDLDDMRLEKMIDDKLGSILGIPLSTLFLLSYDGKVTFESYKNMSSLAYIATFLRISDTGVEASLMVGTTAMDLQLGVELVKVDIDFSDLEDITVNMSLASIDDFSDVIDSVKIDPLVIGSKLLSLVVDDRATSMVLEALVLIKSVVALSSVAANTVPGPGTIISLALGLFSLMVEISLPIIGEAVKANAMWISALHAKRASLNADLSQSNVRQMIDLLEGSVLRYEHGKWVRPASNDPRSGSTYLFSGLSNIISSALSGMMVSVHGRSGFLFVNYPNTSLMVSQVSNALIAALRSRHDLLVDAMIYHADRDITGEIATRLNLAQVNATISLADAMSWNNIRTLIPAALRPPC